MFTWLPSPLQYEIPALAQQYGAPLSHSVDLSANTYIQRLGTRQAEVCMVVRRPSGHLLTMTKTFYPPNCYRLMTGGIEPGETIYAALQREVYEETGLTCQTQCFLAAVTYAANDRPRFATFAFLLQETGGTLGALDPDENVGAYREITIDELPTLADHLDHLAPTQSAHLRSTLRDWGHFRAIIHRLVWQRLQAPPHLSER